MGATRLEDFVSEAELAALYRPTEAAEGLPGRIYYDEAFYDLERRDYFPRGWMAAAGRAV